MLVRELNELQRASARYRHIPAGRIRAALQRPAERPLFPAMFVVHVEPEDVAEGSGLWGPPSVVGVQVEHALALNVEVRRGGRIFYDIWGDRATMYVASYAIYSLCYQMLICSISSPKQLELLVKQVDAVVNAIVSEPDAALMTLLSNGVVPEKMTSVVRAAPSATLRDAKSRTPMYWLERYALEQPDWLAVVVASEIEENHQSMDIQRARRGP